MILCCCCRCYSIAEEGLLPSCPNCSFATFRLLPTSGLLSLSIHSEVVTSWQLPALRLSTHLHNDFSNDKLISSPLSHVPRSGLSIKVLSVQKTYPAGYHLDGW